jgi:hypothetical protein
MHHTAHHAIKTRLTMWETFFVTGHDGTPDGATDDCPEVPHANTQN